MALKSQIIWTVVSNFFIIVGAGHGIACIGVIEFLGISNGFRMNADNFSLSMIAPYDKSLGAVALFSLLGQIFLVLSLFFHKNGPVSWLQIPGLVFLWVGFYYLVHNFSQESLSQLGFFCGVPFLVLSIWLGYRIIKEPSPAPQPENL
jgi:hypothetical protein